MRDAGISMVSVSGDPKGDSLQPGISLPAPVLTPTYGVPSLPALPGGGRL